MAQHPLTQHTIKAMQNLITIGEVEFQYLTSHGYGSNHTVGPVHRSWADVERNYEKYLNEALKPESYRQDPMCLRFSQLRNKQCKIPKYPAKVIGQTVALQKAEWVQLFQKKIVSKSLLAVATGRATRKLRRRFSKKYQDYLDHNKKVDHQW